MNIKKTYKGPLPHRQQRPTSVVIVDDYNLDRQAIRRLLEDANDIDVVGEAMNRQQAVSLCRKLSPQVVLLDAHLPANSPLQTIKSIQRASEHTNILILINQPKQKLLRYFFRAGAKGYITKSFNQEKLTQAIRTVATNQYYLTSGLAKQLVCSEEPIKQEEVSHPPLTDRELDVLLQIVEGYPDNLIASHLCLSQKTIAGHRYGLYKKLGVKNNVELVHWVLNQGLMMIDEIFV